MANYSFFTMIVVLVRVFARVVCSFVGRVIGYSSLLFLLGAVARKDEAIKNMTL